MPHKRAKRSVREKQKSERKADLPPSESTFDPSDIPKSMARVLNAESIRASWREKKRKLEENPTGNAQSHPKRRKGHKNESHSMNILPGESLRHFDQRVEDGMRPLVRTAMKSAVSESKGKSKPSLQETSPSDDKGKRKSDDNQGDDSVAQNVQSLGSVAIRKKKKDNEVDFKRATTSAPKRLNDIVQAPPEIVVPPRLKKAAKEGKAVVFSAAHKRMMELERQKAIIRYRELKEAKLKDRSFTV